MPEYDSITAKHYAAWRPPLHPQILAKAFAEGERFSKGLDVGCGVGNSSHTLARYCTQVVGIDPSQEMILRTVGSEQVHFIHQTESIGQMDLGGNYDLFSFAGSLHYQEPDKVLAEIASVAADHSVIVVYDFAVKLGEVVEQLLGEILPEGDYDHRKNFTGVTQSGLREVVRQEERMYFSASAAELAHLILSVKSWREVCFNNETHTTLTQRLSARVSHERGLLRADTYLTRYAF